MAAALPGDGAEDECCDSDALRFLPVGSTLGARWPPRDVERLLRFRLIDSLRDRLVDFFDLAVLLRDRYPLQIVIRVAINQLIVRINANIFWLLINGEGERHCLFIDALFGHVQDMV